MITDLEEDLFLMANLSPRRTGLPFVVWISPRGNARHDIRVKVSPGPKANPEDMVSVALRPNLHVVDGEMSSSDLSLLASWVELNREVLVRYWDGEIEFTEEALEQLKPAPSE